MGKLSQENRMLQCSGQCCKSDTVDPCNTGTRNCHCAEQEVGVDEDSQLLMCMVAVG